MGRYRTTPKPPLKISRLPYYYHVITVYARRHRRLPQPTTHKLQQRHLRTRILHRHAIRLELQVRLAPYIPSIVRVTQQ